MAFDPKWPRYIFASCAYEMRQLATAHELPLLIEHLDDRTDAFMQAPNRAEARITGPFEQEQSKGYHHLLVDMNVLLTSIYGGQKKNPYDIIDFGGLFQERMGQPFPVWNYGLGVGEYNDPDSMTRVQTFLGCLLPIPGKNATIKLQHFGQTDKTDKLKQSVVDARYYIDLDG
jgi:hypothetical protein